MELQLILAGALLLLAAFGVGQYQLCRRTKRLVLRLIPGYGVVLLLILAAVEYASYNPGGFLDLSAFVAAVLAVYAAACAVSSGVGWLVWKIKEKR